MELKPRDRRRREAARSRDGERFARNTGKWEALENAIDARCDGEDRPHRRERELEPGIEREVWIPRQQHDRPEQQCIPAVLLPRCQPGERREHARNRRPHDRRLRTHRERVGEDGGQGARFADEPRKAEQPRERERAARDQSHVLAGDGQQVIEPGGAEAVAQVVGQSLVFAENDALDHAAPLSAQAERGRPAEPQVQPVGESGRPSAASDRAPAIAVKDDVDSLPSQPRAFVEAVHGTARQREAAQHGERRTLRRRPAGGKLEQDRLVDPQPTEAQHSCGNPDLESSAARGRRRLDERVLGSADLVAKGTAVERVEARASPPPACERECERNERETAHSVAPGRERQNDGRDERDGRRRAAHEVRSGEAGAHRGRVSAAEGPAQVVQRDLEARGLGQLAELARHFWRHCVEREDVALALAWQESGHQPNLTSSAGAWGVMQVLPVTWAYAETVLIGRPVPHTTDGGIRVGVAYLNHLIDAFDGNERLALAAYLQGERSVREQGVLPSTEPYVANILALAERSLQH